MPGTTPLVGGMPGTILWIGTTPLVGGMPGTILWIWLGQFDSWSTNENLDEVVVFSQPLCMVLAKYCRSHRPQ